jgi:hypothetical protein
MRGIDQLEKTISDDVADDPPPATANYLFAPVDKRAFGIAIGAAFALVIGAMTVFDLLRPVPWKGLELLNQYFTGYTVSWWGVLIGSAWGFAVGFVAGWLLAFVRNLSLALSLFLIRSRAELDEASDFLDHI